MIDDVPLLFDSPQAAQILMAAVGGDPGEPRRVTYVTKGLRRVTAFRGGVIAIGNRPLRHDPAGRALASRMATLEHEPTDEMLVAFMEAEARKGVKDVPADECLMVVGHVVEVCRGLEDYWCWKSEVCETDWRVLVRSSVRQVGADELPPAPASRAGTKALEYEVVRELHGLETPSSAPSFSPADNRAVRQVGPPAATPATRCHPRWPRRALIRQPRRTCPCRS